MLTARISRHRPHQPHMHGTTQRADAAAASARLLPHGDSTFPGAARFAILDPLRHR
jgi:hypothetical protein